MRLLFRCACGGIRAYPIDLPQISRSWVHTLWLVSTDLVLSVIFKERFVFLVMFIVDLIVSAVGHSRIQRGAKQEHEAVIKQGKYVNT